MKIDRLIAEVIYLLNREVVSASTLANRFEVSKRTIQRDMDTLNQAGIPIVSTYGAEGGYEIMDGFKLTKQIVDVDDCRNIVTALKALTSAYNNNKINTTLEKVIHSLQDKEPRIFMDLSVAREDEKVNDYLRTMDYAINNKLPIIIEYTNSEMKPSIRKVEPLGLTYQWYSWYLLAYCTAKQAYRLFKLTRISSCELSKDSFSKIHGNVEELLRKVISTDQRKYYKIRLRCKKSIKQQVFEYLSRNLIEEYENGDFVVELHVPFERMWFSLLLGFGNQIEVLEPDEIKILLREKAEEILSLY